MMTISEENGASASLKSAFEKIGTSLVAAAPEADARSAGDEQQSESDIFISDETISEPDQVAAQHDAVDPSPVESEGEVSGLGSVPVAPGVGSQDQLPGQDNGEDNTFASNLVLDETGKPGGFLGQPVAEGGDVVTISDSDSLAGDVAPADDAIEGVGTTFVRDVPAVEDEQAKGGGLLMSDGPVS
jgi:hypothetical protein